MDRGNADRMVAIITVILLVAVSHTRATGCVSGELQLLEDDTLNVCIDNIWRTVCRDKINNNNGNNVNNEWNGNAPNVACKQLGYNKRGATAILPCKQNDENTYATILSCTGLENTLQECNDLVPTNEDDCRSNNCDDDEYNTVTLACQPADCSKSEVRLVNGTSYREGRVEVCVGGRWGTVCGEGWTNEDAGHVCAYLGYPREGAEVRIDHFSPGTAPIKNCTNIQTSTCTTATNCERIMEAGVVCKSYDQVADIIRNKTIEQDCPIQPPTVTTTPPLPVTCPSQTTSTTNATTTLKDNQSNCEFMNTEQSIMAGSGQCNTVTSVLGVLVGLLTAVLVTISVTCSILVIRRHKQSKQQQQTRQHRMNGVASTEMTSTEMTSTEMTSTVERSLVNPAYNVNIPKTLRRTTTDNEYGSSGPTYEAVANGNPGYSTLNHDINKNSVVRLSAVEEHEYHVLEYNGQEGVDCEGMYSVAREGADCEGVYSVATGEGVATKEGVATGEGVVCDYEIPRNSKAWLEDEYSTLKH